PSARLDDAAQFAQLQTGAWDVFDDVVHRGGVEMTVREARVTKCSVEHIQTAHRGCAAGSLIGLDAHNLKRRTRRVEQLAGRTTDLDEPSRGDESLKITKPLARGQFAPGPFARLDFRVDQIERASPLRQPNHLRRDPPAAAVLIWRCGTDCSLP